jgi:hypothetical protein
MVEPDGMNYHILARTRQDQQKGRGNVLKINWNLILGVKSSVLLFLC